MDRVAPLVAPVETRGLCKSYHNGEISVDVLKDVDLRVEKGEFVSVMGPSGSGKSTLLYLLGGLDEPTQGRVLINGCDLSSLSDRESSRLRRREIGFVFQFYNLVPNLNVEENVLLPALLDGRDLRQLEERLDEILRAVELADRRRHTPRELSGGEQQRVAIARALLNDPDLLLCDEPTGNLDTHTGEGVLALLRRINEERGCTVVMVTHSRTAAAYGRRLVRVLDGEVKDEHSD